MRRGSKLNRLLDHYLGIPLLHTLALTQPPRTRSLPQNPRRIGVLCSPALGDTLLFSGPLLDLRRHFPHTEILHICMPENRAAAELIAGADRRLLVNLARPHQGIRALRAENLDALLDFSSWQRVTALHTLMSRARFTAGFASPAQHRTPAYDLTVPHSNALHELQNFRALLTALRIPATSPPTIATPPLDPTAWQTLWRASTPTPTLPDSPLIVFHPWPAGAQSHLREWPEPNWIALAQSLSQTIQATFVITGSPAEQHRVLALVSALRAAGLPATPFSAPLRAVAGLLRHAALAVAVNTGIMHLAAILGTPTLALNGPTAEHRWGPRGRCAQGISPEDGSGGYLHFGFEYPPNPEPIMHRISVPAALAAALELLACGSVQ